MHNRVFLYFNKSFGWELTLFCIRHLPCLVSVGCMIDGSMEV